MYLRFWHSTFLFTFLFEIWPLYSEARELISDLIEESYILEDSGRKLTLAINTPPKYSVKDGSQNLTTGNEPYFPEINSQYVAHPFRDGILHVNVDVKKNQERLSEKLKKYKTRHGEAPTAKQKEKTDDATAADDDEFWVDNDMIIDKKSQPPIRHRRSAKPKRIRTSFAANIEVCIVVDYKLYKIFLERTGLDHKRALGDIRRYFAATVAMMNERFKGINDPTLSIKVMLSNVFIAQSVMESSWTERYRETVKGEEVINATKVMKSMMNWVSADKLGKYDHVILFTAYPMVNQDGDILKGMAFVGEICNQKTSVSLVNDIGAFQSAGVAAHELGHSLGADHDGVKENENCSARHNYIMSPNEHNNETTRYNYMYLSKCSIRQIKKILRSGNAECVFDKPRSIYTYDLRKYPPGRSYSANEQCKMIYGKNSGTCEQTRLLDRMCFTLWCRDPIQTNTCRSMGGVRAAPGTKCDTDKMCWRGSCIEEFRRKKPQCLAKTKSCKGRDKNRQYCSILIKLNPYACQRAEVIKYCCQTCKRCHKRRSRRRRRVKSKSKNKSKSRRRRTRAQAYSS